MRRFNRPRKRETSDLANDRANAIDQRSEVFSADHKRRHEVDGSTERTHPKTALDKTASQSAGISRKFNYSDRTLDSDVDDPGH